ncbi:MAG: hypothetical protein DMG11_15310 [Acidobacteria bacterium]|nr:MAG: hypothetical protein DMG11_15310 [Acidobacteriota bacterium]
MSNSGKEPQGYGKSAANYTNYAKWAHQRILDAPIWRNSRNSRLIFRIPWFLAWVNAGMRF